MYLFKIVKMYLFYICKCILHGVSYLCFFIVYSFLLILSFNDPLGPVSKLWGKMSHPTLYRRICAPFRSLDKVQSPLYAHSHYAKCSFLLHIMRIYDTLHSFIFSTWRIARLLLIISAAPRYLLYYLIISRCWTLFYLVSNYPFILCLQLILLLRWPLLLLLF